MLASGIGIESSLLIQALVLLFATVQFGKRL
jgi:hypothetical protein